MDESASENLSHVIIKEIFITQDAIDGFRGPRDPPAPMDRQERSHSSPIPGLQLKVPESLDDHTILLTSAFSTSPSSMSEATQETPI